MPGVIEILETRELLATFAVTSHASSGAGSLRQAIIDSNAQPGGNTINFDVAGTIRISRASLPAITEPVTIDGTTAPSFAGTPVVTVNFRGTKGLNFAPGSDGSTLKSLSLIKAGNSGVTLTASNITVQGNDIGLQADGTTRARNRGDGVRINASSHGDLIGRSDPVSSINYYNTDSVSMPVSGWQGIRAGATSGQYLITGTSNSNGLLYEGPISGSNGTSYTVNYPGASSTSVYGPDLLAGGEIRLVGSYNNGIVNGFVFQGTTADLSDGGAYQTIDYPDAQYTYVHSTMGDLAVGNADGIDAGLPDITGHAFIYDLATSTFLPNIVYPGSKSTTAYGIWYNGGTSYTICGGYSNGLTGPQAIGNAYLVNFDSGTQQFSDWARFAYPNGVAGENYETHFQGISSTEKGVYTLSADAGYSGRANPLNGSWVTVRLNADGSFGLSSWVDLHYPGSNPSTSATSNDSVIGNQVVGFVTSGEDMFSYQATINTAYQLSNVISGNGGNGIGIYGASDNQIAMNNIGTDVTGTLERGNAKNGILVTNGATGNLIGGQATNGNDPTNNAFVRPPQGNLISGNGADGIMIKNGATQTIVSGNFVGTAASGNTALGNRLDGVAIVNASGNQLIGCTYQENPFVFYNVLSGNGGNGLRITNSNETTVQANFLGIGANNATTVANGGDGLLVSGSSANTQVGGVIPLGNVISGNDKNGIEETGTASGLTSFNTFAGLYAFTTAAPNKQNGILITSSGGNNLIRTCIVSGNLGNGIVLAGNANDVQITDTTVGTNSDIQAAVPNGGNGIVIAGHAHNNAIGGFQPSIEPGVTVDASGGYGIQITGSATNNVVFDTIIGSNPGTTTNLGNALGGIYLGPGTSGTTIGGAAAPLQVNILYSSLGAGVTIDRSSGNTVVGDNIQYNDAGGVVVTGGRNDLIGLASAGNTISNNGQDGLYVTGILTGTAAAGNQIESNAGNGVNLFRARGITIGGSALGAGNQILTNQAYGVYGSGNSTGSVVAQNVIAENVAGNVNLSSARGITYIP